MTELIISIKLLVKLINNYILRKINCSRKHRKFLKLAIAIDGIFNIVSYRFC